MASFILMLLCLTLCALVAVVLGRMLSVRRSGIAIAVRRAGQPEGQGWRSGVVHFSDTELSYYRHGSMKFKADRVIARHTIHLSSRRDATHAEVPLLPEDSHILQVRIDGIKYEVAMNVSGDTALTSWLESAPSQRRDFVFTPHNTAMMKKFH